MPDPDARFRCPVFACELSVRACLLRHVKVWASGGRRGAKAIRPCGSCRVGAALLLATPAFVPPRPTDAPEVLPERQRRARVRWMRERLDEPRGRELEALAEVALVTPDDEGIEHSE